MILEAVHITPEYVEATEGHVLIRVPASGIPVEDFPVVAGMGNGTGEMLVSAQALRDAGKGIKSNNRIPVCNVLHVGLDAEGRPVMTDTDLETPTVRVAQKVEERFPDCDVVIPKAETVKTEVTFRASLLRQIAAFVAKYGMGHEPAMTIGLQEDTGCAARITFTLEDGREALVVLMPCRK